MKPQYSDVFHKTSWLLPKLLADWVDVVFENHMGFISLQVWTSKEIPMEKAGKKGRGFFFFLFALFLTRPSI